MEVLVLGKKREFNRQIQMKEMQSSVGVCNEQTSEARG